jgi:hypothetical protein
MLSRCNYRSGAKTVQTLDTVSHILYQPRFCANQACEAFRQAVGSSEWVSVAPRGGTYGYDVIATIGWRRQQECRTFEEVHRVLQSQVVISEAQVRYLYHQQYLPLLACHERQHIESLRSVSEQRGLLLTLDGLAPEGGEAQLWVIRELRTGLTVRSGWMSQQDQTAFEHFLSPIAEAGLRVTAVLSDKQRGLLPAVTSVFPSAPHAFCQSHYLKNLAEPIAELDTAMKVTLRKTVREHLGPTLRTEAVDAPGVLTVTGLLPSAVDGDKGETPLAPAEEDHSPDTPKKREDRSPAPQKKSRERQTVGENRS